MIWEVRGGNSSVVERYLAKVDVAGSNPVSRSIFILHIYTYNGAAVISFY